MTAVLLAAGFGTRLRPLTNSIPKPLLAIGEHPILVWNLLLLKRHGILDAIINLHYRGDQIVAALGDGSRFGMRLAYSHEPAILGTGGGIKQAASYFPNGPLLVMNGDTLSECNLTALISRHYAAKAQATLAVRDDPQAATWGAVAMEHDGRIGQIKDQPPRGNVMEPLSAGYMFAGIHVLSPAVVDAIPPGPGSIIDVYIELLRQGQPLYGYVMTGYWSDIGTPERYSEAREKFPKISYRE